MAEPTRVLAVAHDAEGRITRLVGNGPLVPNEAWAWLAELPRLESVRVDHNTPARGSDESLETYDGAGLAALAERVPHDLRRVFCAGHSGGGMTLRAAAEIPERFAAVGMVAGLLAVDDPRPSRPVPTLYILGTADPLVPMLGGAAQTPWGTRQHPPVAEPLARWAAAIGCETEPRTVSDADGVRKLEYPSKSGGPTLTVLYLEGHGHNWPGAKSALSESVMGPNTSRLHATDVIWDFFEATAARDK